MTGGNVFLWFIMSGESMMNVILMSQRLYHIKFQIFVGIERILAFFFNLLPLFTLIDQSLV